MGLDQYLYKKEEVLYWRKANQIQNWFDKLSIERTGKPIQNCEDFQITKEDIENLLDDCEKAIELYKSNNIDELEDLMPTVAGFFFGPTDYNEGYLNNLEEAVRGLKELLDEDSDATYIYNAWW
jgi:hypothetical protein